MTTLPSIDFGEYGLHLKDHSEVDETVLLELGKKIKDAFSQFGVCYLKNHGVDNDMVKEYMKVSREFFEQKYKIKQEYALKADIRFGWIGLEKESINTERPGDIKEAFNYSPSYGNASWPKVNRFEELTKQLYTDCAALSLRFCDILSLALGLPTDFMRNAHRHVGKEGNSTTIRTLYYPPIPPESSIKPRQIRLGEHSDYGSMTFLFQDDIGGLEMFVPERGYVPVTPIQGTIIVHTADLMQRWTSDVMLAAKHRVLIPKEEFRKRNCRQSIAFFVEPDDNFSIKCLDGSDKYKPITPAGYLKQKFYETF